ncbi:hypothetical protein LZ30DRAFT_791420, partial [Colletotrichum cereale]
DRCSCPALPLTALLRPHGAHAPCPCPCPCPPTPCHAHGPCPMLFERALLRTATAVPLPHQHQQSADTAVPQYLLFLFFILPQLAPAPAHCTVLRRPGWVCGLWTVDRGWTSTCLLFFSHHQKQNLPTPVFFLFFLPLTTPPTTSNIPLRTAKEARTVSQTSTPPTVPNAPSSPFILLFYALDRLQHTTSFSSRLPHHSSPASLLHNPPPLLYAEKKNPLANVPALEEFGRARRKRNRSKEKRDDQHDPSLECVFMWCLVPA